MDEPIYEIPVTPPAGGRRRWRIDESADDTGHAAHAAHNAGADAAPEPPATAPTGSWSLSVQSADEATPASSQPESSQSWSAAGGSYNLPPTREVPTAPLDGVSIPGTSYTPPPTTPTIPVRPVETPVPPAAPAFTVTTPVPVEDAVTDRSRASAPSQAAPAQAGPATASGTPADERRASRQAADPDLIAALQEVVYSTASDLHVTANAAPMLRVDGALRPVPGSRAWDSARVAEALYSIITPEERKRFERELELDFAYTVSANARFRVNYYQQRDAIGGAFRLIPTEIKQLKELGVPEQVGSFSSLPRGLVLVTGPTGSGKSTTLAALVDLANSSRSDHIVTVEDPIEFLHNHKRSIVNQREVGHDTHSFASALKHVLRQDPDVILIGELRDLETISVALTAAETGHLVFATLHTQDAPQTIDRMIDVFPPHQQGQVRAQLAATLQGVVCQTLVARASGTGRAVATEVMMTTPAIANLIREGKTFQIASAMQAGRAQGMHTMDQHLAELVNTGAVTRQAAMEKVHDPAGFDRLIDRLDTGGGRPGAPGAPGASAAYSPAGLGGIDFGDKFSGKEGGL